MPTSVSLASISHFNSDQYKGNPSSLDKMADNGPSPPFLRNFQKVECACDAVRDAAKAKSKDVFLIQVPSKVSRMSAPSGSQRLVDQTAFDIGL